MGFCGELFKRDIPFLTENGIKKIFLPGTMTDEVLNFLDSEVAPLRKKVIEW